MRRAALLLAALALMVPANAAGAVRSKLDRDAGVRLTLDGRTLTAEIVETPRFNRDPTTEEMLYGKRIDGICSPAFRPTRREVLVTTRLWPRSARSVSFRLGRDISRRVKWCLIEHEARDVAAVSFQNRERTRLVGKGRGPSGAWWRLGGWRGWLEEPCVLLRIRGAATPACFDQFSEREATLGVELWAPCGDMYFFGVVGRAAANVRLTLADGSTVAAHVYDRAAGSRVRARFFAAALPEGTVVRLVQALDLRGAPIAERRVRDYAREPCG